MPLSFRQRIFLVLAALTAVPIVLAVIGWALAGWRGAPDFEALRQALRELAGALDVARDRELEAERLRAFREVARRVAHEIKNPLTSMRIAVDQLRRSGDAAEGRAAVAVDVLAAE